MAMNWKPSAMLWMKSSCLIVVMFAVRSDDAFEDLHVDEGTWHDVALVGRQDDEAVGLRHRAQDARALLAGHAHGPAPCGILAQYPALELGAAGRLLEGRGAWHLERR